MDVVLLPRMTAVHRAKHFHSILWQEDSFALKKRRQVRMDCVKMAGQGFDSEVWSL